MTPNSSCWRASPFDRREDLTVTVATITPLAHRLETMLNAVGAPETNATLRGDGLTQTVRLNEYDDVCITAAGEDTAILTVVTTTRAARRMLRSLAQSYGRTPGVSGL